MASRVNRSNGMANQTAEEIELIRLRKLNVRNYCFTLNNPTGEEREFWTDILAHGHEEIMYIRLQEERGAGTDTNVGTLHFQGYMELKGRARYNHMKQTFGQRVHWEDRRGTQRQADEYCDKAETEPGGYVGTVYAGPLTYVGLKDTWGSLKRKGSDRFELAVNHLKSGGSFKTLKEDFSVQYAMHKNKLTEYAIGLKPQRHWQMDIQIFVGATGAGKTTEAWKVYPDAYACPWPVQGHWWMPNYEGQEVIILDDFDGQISLEAMMVLFDRHPWPGLEAKGISFKFCSKIVVITTNVDPRDWFKKHKTEEVHMSAMRRRIREFATIVDFSGGPEDYPDFPRDTRMDMDVFDWNPRGDQDTIPAGNGDMSQGNGYGGMGGSQLVNYGISQDTMDTTNDDV